jgi:hypothetical protein
MSAEENYLTPTTPPLEDILAEGDRVAFRVTIRGTHRGWGGLDLFDLRHQLQT